MEKRLTILETRLDAILPTLATKADIDALRVELHKSLGEVHKAVAETYKWIVGTMIGLFIGLAGVFLAMKPEPSAVQTPQQAITAQPGTPLPSTQGNSKGAGEAR